MGMYYLHQRQNRCVADTSSATHLQQVSATLQNNDYQNNASKSVAGGR